MNRADPIAEREAVVRWSPRPPRSWSTEAQLLLSKICFVLETQRQPMIAPVSP